MSDMKTVAHIGGIVVSSEDTAGTITNTIGYSASAGGMLFNRNGTVGSTNVTTAGLYVGGNGAILP